MIYLDNSATTPITEPVFEAMLPYLKEFYGNPSSQYKIGRVAKAAITKARKQFAKAINAEPEQIFFTSGATESNNLIRRNYNTISSLYEHPSMKTKFQVVDNGGLGVELNKAGRRGIRDLVVCWQYVNSETGKIFPIKEYTDLAHTHGYKFHSDCTAAFGKVPIDVKDLDIDFASFSGHKFHAPKGIGVLYIKEPDKFRSDIIGGGQEFGLRSGTENVPAIVGLGKAAELYNYSDERNNIAIGIRLDIIRLLAQKLSCNFKILEGGNNVPSILNIAFPNIEGESIMLLLDNKDICVSTGSACHSASLEASPTVKSFNLPPEYEHGTIRISFDENFEPDEVEYVTDEIARICNILTEIRKG